MTFRTPDRYRIVTGAMASMREDSGDNGVFRFASASRRAILYAIASDGAGWEHVSVRAVIRKGRSCIPTWHEMCQTKREFWDDDDAVMQLHPPESEYINAHPHVLHLWRPVAHELIRPPHWLVGPLET